MHSVRQILFLAAMFDMAAETRLFLRQVRVVELTADMAIGATLIHRGGSFGRALDKRGEVEHVRIGSSGCFANSGHFLHRSCLGGW